MTKNKRFIKMQKQNPKKDLLSKTVRMLDFYFFLKYNMEIKADVFIKCGNKNRYCFV